jgi:hypothetical protein
MKRFKMVSRSVVAVGALCCIAFPATAKEEILAEKTVEAHQPKKLPAVAENHEGHRHGASQSKQRAPSKGEHADVHPHKRTHSHGPAPAGEPHQHHEAGSGHGHAHGSEASSHGHDHEHGEGLTEFLYGFVTGSDIAAPPHRHIVFDVNGDFGKRSGTYNALFDHVELGFVPWENFHVGLGASYTYHRISGVRGLEEPSVTALASPPLLYRDNGDFDGLNVEFRQRFLDREKAPFGLTLIVEPEWARVEELSGAPVNKHAVGFVLAADKDIVPDTVFVAFNAYYEPEWVELLDTREREQESTAGLAASAMVRLSSSVFLGGDIRYFRQYEGAALNALAGEALFAGPNIFAIWGELFITAAFEAQLWGNVPGEQESLDLDNFTRYQAKLRVVSHF